MTEEVLKVISSDEEIDELIAYLKDFEYCAYDTETDGLSLNANVVGISVAAEENLGWYVITAVYDPESKELVKLNNREKVIELIIALLSKKLITHHGIVDFNWTNVNYGIQLKDSCFHDTMLSSHLLDENRESHGLKERGLEEFGESAKKEQQEMKASVIANGGVWEEKRGGNKEMYKADPYILGKYGAKDAILTLKLFYLDVPRLYEEGLDKFFYEDETMPLYKGPTYDLNTTGLKVDTQLIKQTEIDLKREIDELRIKILSDVEPYVKERYPGTNKKNTFNIGSSSQMAWLLFIKLGYDWKTLTDSGKELAKSLIGKVPYRPGARKAFAEAVSKAKNKKGKPYKLESLIQCDKDVIADFASKHEWCKNLLKYKQLCTILKTYIIAIQKQMEYGIIHPSFSQIGTVGPRYSSNNPNFQNLPRKDKRVKKCIIARPGKVFVGADQEQLEPRCFAAMSGDSQLCSAFTSGQDFYSVIGIDAFHITDAVPLKEGHPDAFGIKYPHLRDNSKAGALAASYGTTEYRLTNLMRDEKGQKLSLDECRDFIQNFFDTRPDVKKMVDKTYNQVIETGVTYNLFGRPRRLPEAKTIKAFGKVSHRELPYKYRNLLNQSINSRIQNTGSSILNRAAISVHNRFKERGIDAQIVLNIHDELVIECWIKDKETVSGLLKDSMENTVQLPNNVKLSANPKIAYNLADLK